MKEVKFSGDLSYYLVDVATKTVKQVKTNRATGRQFATTVTNPKKIEQVLKAAA